ncbi:hypothetical protein B0T14DRAFT_566575 [Immersiella caudata]|uniref:Uncharacterized protein n=1 Tax=Immersiella caudata TaxID=314043 RepID=A0AA39WQN6_9PEZI|nr:hypothetical protein B0T14DRAFT_566575 [Immersiella caudata]
MDTLTIPLSFHLHLYLTYLTFFTTALATAITALLYCHFLDAILAFHVKIPTLRSKPKPEVEKTPGTYKEHCKALGKPCLFDYEIEWDAGLEDPFGGRDAKLAANLKAWREKMGEE